MIGETIVSRKIRFRFITGVVIAMCVAGADLSLAQEFRASILGQVADSSGAAIAGATVTVVEHSTHTTYTAKSNSSGVYSVDFILPGEFTVTVEAQGFRQEVYSNVTLQAAQKLNLNVTLSVAVPVVQQVTVTASPGLLDASDAATGGVLDQIQIQLMPLECGETWQDLTFVQGEKQFTASWGTYSDKSDVASFYSVNGAPQADNTFYLNGAPVSASTQWNYSAPRDAVQEVQANVGSYDAQWGPAAGGSFNQVIKEGTNRFHGTIYQFLQNALFGANTYANNLAGVAKGISNQSYSGASVGGPIQKDRTFFFATWESQRDDQPHLWISTVPTLLERTGNFQGTGYTVYDPSTVTCVTQTSSGCSAYSRTAFQNDTIPQGDINPIGAAIMALYPQPTNSALASNYTHVLPVLSGYDEYLGRLDHIFSSSTRISAIYTRIASFSRGGSSNGFTTEGATTTSGPTPEDTNGMIDLTRTLSPSMVMDFRASVSRWYDFSSAGTAVQDNYSIPGLTMPIVPTTTHLNIAPTVAVTNYASLIGDTANGTIDNYGYLSPSLEQIKGRHTLHYGFEYEDIQVGATGVPSTPNGAFTFSGQWSRANPLTAATGSGNALADLLLGYPASGSVGWGINDMINYHYYGTYFQDDFKVSRKVTLNMGLRWDLDSSPSERHNGINGTFCFTCTNPYTSQINYASYPTLQNPLTGGLTFAGVSSPHAPDNVSFTHWQPRVGIAWAITPKTVVRAGFGIFYNYGNSATTNTGFTQSTSYVDSLNGNVNPTPYFLNGKPYPNGVLAPTGAQGGLETSAGNAISYDSPSGNGAIPWTQHWSVGIQRELPQRILLDVEYVGSHNHAIQVSQPWGVISSAEQAACFANIAVCNTAVSNPFYGVLPSTTTLGASATLSAYQLQRQNPLFSGVTESNDPIGYQDYNALEVRVARQVKSINFVWNYTYSNWTGDTAYLNAGTWRDANLWHGPSSADIPHYFNMNAVWPLPVGRGRTFFQNAHGWAGGLLNDWTVDGVYIYWSGEPLAISNANLVGSPGCTSYYPAGGQDQQHWFNNTESCYQQLSTYQERTTPLYVGYLRNPAWSVMNASLQKSFVLPWREMSLTARFDTTNTLNHPCFNGPNTTVSQVPSFTQWVGWSGFGALPTTSFVNSRYGVVSIKLSF